MKNLCFWGLWLLLAIPIRALFSPFTPFVSLFKARRKTKNESGVLYQDRRLDYGVALIEQSTEGASIFPRRHRKNLVRDNKHEGSKTTLFYSIDMDEEKAKFQAFHAKIVAALNQQYSRQIEAISVDTSGRKLL